MLNGGDSSLAISTWAGSALTFGASIRDPPVIVTPFNSRRCFKSITNNSAGCVTAAYPVNPLSPAGIEPEISRMLRSSGLKTFNADLVPLDVVTQLLIICTREFNGSRETTHGALCTPGLTFRSRELLFSGNAEISAPSYHCRSSHSQVAGIGDPLK